MRRSPILPRDGGALFPRVKANGAARPLFSSYLFVLLGYSGEGWTVVNRALGILRMIAFGDRPARMPEKEVAALKARMDEPGCIVLPPPPSLSKRKFAKGDPVRIRGEAFEGVAAVHSGMTANEREIVLIGLLGSTRQVAVPAHLIAAR